MSRLPLRSGLVIRYSFRFSSGHEKVRPALVALAICLEAKADDPLFVLLPITHAPPRRLDGVALELPAEIRNTLHLDDERSYLVITEANFASASQIDYEISPLPGQKSSWFYGQMPNSYLKICLSLLRENLALLKLQSRDEPPLDLAILKAALHDRNNR